MLLYTEPRLRKAYVAATGSKMRARRSAAKAAWAVVCSPFGRLAKRPHFASSQVGKARTLRLAENSAALWRGYAYFAPNMGLIAGMFAVWAGWLLFSGTFVGLGCALLRVSTDPSAKWDVGTAFWSGFSVTISILQVSNLFSAIGLTTTTALVGFGLGSLCLHVARLRVVHLRKPFGWKVILLALALIWLSNRALQAPLLEDSGIYHLSSIRWANQLPLPPGLGNLHGRLAFNQSYFLYVAFLNNFPVVGFGHNLANSLLLAAAILTVCEKGLRYQPHELNNHLNRLLIPFTLFFCAMCYRSNPPLISSPTPDAAVFAVEIVLAALLLQFFARDCVAEADARSTLVAIVSLATVAITLKLSTLVFAGATLVSAVTIALRFRTMHSRTMRSLAFATFVILVWVVRGVVASGYLVYPIRSTGLPVDWKIPEHLVVDELNSIGAWARLPYHPWREVIGSWNWIPQWLVRTADRPDTVAAFSLMSVTLMYFVLAPKASPRRAGSAIGPLSVILGIGLCSLIFWFLSAPDPRFLGAVLWIVVLGVVGLVFDRVSIEQQIRLSKVLVLLSWIAVALCFARNSLALTYSTKGKLAESTTKPDLIGVITGSGLTVYTPVRSDECWDAPLPCTPYFRPQLKLRGKSLSEGFYLDESAVRAPDF